MFKALNFRQPLVVSNKQKYKSNLSFKGYISNAIDSHDFETLKITFDEAIHKDFCTSLSGTSCYSLLFCLICMYY